MRDGRFQTFGSCQLCQLGRRVAVPKVAGFMSVPVLSAFEDSVNDFARLAVEQ